MRVAIRKLSSNELRILGLLLSGETLAPEEIAIKLDVPNQSVRNRLVFLKKNQLVDRVGYAQYKLSARGRDHLDFISQPSQDRTLRRSAEVN